MHSINSLVVEDNSIFQKIMHNILKSYGTCTIAKNGLEGLEQYKKSLQENNHYDLICLDIEMPKMDGVSLLDKIRKLEQEHLPEKRSIIVMVTAYGEQDIVRKCCRLGCSSFLIKPVDRHNLEKVLKKHKLLMQTTEEVA
ncbi:MAG: response regulator [Calditrichaeota bacterium]|nr:response regulator [Calditrichota bacterium]